MVERRGGPGWSIHPGEILKEEFLIPLDMSEYKLAQGISVNPQRINDITQLKTGISADMAMRLGKFFNTSAEFWMNLQASYELSSVKGAAREAIDAIVPLSQHKAA